MRWTGTPIVIPVSRMNPVPASSTRSFRCPRDIQGTCCSSGAGGSGLLQVHHGPGSPGYIYEDNVDRRFHIFHPEWDFRRDREDEEHQGPVRDRLVHQAGFPLRGTRLNLVNLKGLPIYSEGNRARLHCQDKHCTNNQDKEDRGISPPHRLSSRATIYRKPAAWTSLRWGSRCRAARRDRSSHRG